MTYKEYTERMAPLLARYNNAKRNKCPLTARARVRDMAKLYAAYRGADYKDAYRLFANKLENNEIIPS